MRVYKQTERLFDPSELLGIAIRSLNPESPHQKHVGLIYSDVHGKPRFCHLAWHFDLRDEGLSPKYLWGTSGLDQINKTFMAAYIALLKQNATSIPYGIDYSAPFFDDNGKYVVQPIGSGLTCATFILAVFEQRGFNLLMKESWPSRLDDAEWQSGIISALEKHAKPEHIEAMKANIGGIRFRPEEVTAGFTSEDIPIDFESSSKIAAEILKDIYGDQEPK